MAASEIYSLDSQINKFFKKTSTTRQACDDKVTELSGGPGEPAPMQGECSYTVFAGSSKELVFQFRLKSLFLDLNIIKEARKVYGRLAPETTFHGSLGSDGGKLESLLVYRMNKVPAVSYIEAQVTSPFHVDSPERLQLRSIIMADFARFFAMSWKSPQILDAAATGKLRHHYLESLRLLLVHLPTRFHPAIQQRIQDMPLIFSLPMVLTHSDLSAFNIIVDEIAGELTGIIDWAEASVAPFGHALTMLRNTSGSYWLKKGWKLYPDHDELHRIFWTTLEAEIGAFAPETKQAIMSCRILSCLMEHGFTRRLANEPPPVPIGGDDYGQYHCLSLDGLLINLETRFGLDRI